MTSRERFEATNFCVDKSRHPEYPDRYWSTHTQLCWEVWQSRDEEVRELVEALRDAIDEVENWGAYASEYFQEKHDLSGTVAKLRAILAKHESGGE